MSKIIEALKVRSSKPEEGVPMRGPKEVTIEHSSHEMTQEQLADIYFAATGKPKTQEPPVIIRLIERPRLATWIPWLIASLAFLITSLSLFSTKRIFIDVKFIDEESPVFRSSEPIREDPPSLSRPEGAAVEEASPRHKVPVQNFLFEGAAYLNSSKDKSGGLTLINSSVAPFARATLHLDPPVDLSRSKLVFYAKGWRGGENVAFAIKDKDNVQGFYKGKIYPFPDKLTTSWQKAEIDMHHDTTKDFDRSSVTNLRFEFGAKDTGNKPNDTIFIKDMHWTTE
jgi:hypothetical protein